MKRIVCCALALVACSSAAASAGECCDHCDRCGCQSACRKVCRVVCETKKVPKVTYSCECEDFCVPGPSSHSVACDECGKKKHIYTPTCAEVRSRKKLVKHETFEEVPSHKWVVETMCDACASKCGGDTTVAADGGAGTQRENGPSLATQASYQEKPGITAHLRQMLPALGRK
jgi:hypothetical protein